MKSYLLKIRGGVEVDSLGKKAGKGPLVAEEVSATLGVSQDQYLFQPITFEPGIAAREGGHIYEGVSGTLRSNAGDNQMHVAHQVINLNKDDVQSKQILDPKGGASYSENVMPTLCSDSHGTPHAVCYWDGGQTVGTLTANNAGGGQRMPDKNHFQCVIEQVDSRGVQRTASETDNYTMQ